VVFKPVSGFVEKYQNLKFEKRSRIEDGTESTRLITLDRYFYYMYSSTLERMLEELDLAMANSPKILELGSSGGITKKVDQKIFTSDIRIGSNLDLILDASIIPIKSNSIDGIIAKDVLHHIPNIEKHFKEVERVLKVGGKVVYAEPNWNFISRIVFTFFHPEPWVENVKSWNFQSNDPMYSNQARSKIIFIRDITLFSELFPKLIVNVKDVPINALSHLLSLGIYAKKKIVPRSILIQLSKLEHKSNIWMKLFGFMRIIVLEKT
jgi:SAM-dependent methyltransferase